ncbi:hypothetical protein V3O24_04440 [Methylobacter sp. Wu8]|uniref:hypothetical protein n=1 Tax=Methylobacter sp. Wu8 TaxID=3118457 RepID=UPI002F2E1AAC
MAKSHIYCATDGCSNRITLIGHNRKEADRKAEWAQVQGFICEDCKQNQRDQAAVKAADQNAAIGLPALTGSDKQIAWAEKLRAEKLDTITKALSGDMPRLHIDAYWGTSGWRQEAIAIDDANTSYAVELLKQQTRASWWIDQRESKIGFILRDLFVAHPPEQPIEADQQAIIDDAKAEATVRPQKPITETVAEISITPSGVSVRFPEKIESFRLLIKKHGFTWADDHWQRTLVGINGNSEDRAAEIGHSLLGNHFIVRQYNVDIRDAMINGRFQSEQTRWIALYTRGKETGRLCIRWSKDEDYYRAAKRIPTARYVKPHLSVAVEQFEQVQDFAEVNNFSITTAAKTAMDEAQRVKRESLIAKVDLPEQTKSGDDGKPVRLAMPEYVDVDDDLRD